MTASNPVTWNAWTESIGLDPSRPDLDHDRDGIADAFEYLRGSDPWQPDSGLLHVVPDPAGGIGCSFEWAENRSGFLLGLQRSGDLVGWEPVSDSLLDITDIPLGFGRYRRHIRVDDSAAASFFRLSLSPTE